MAADLELVRMAVALAMFASASWFDLRKRSVSDYLWILFAVITGILYIFDFPTTFSEGMMIVLSVALSTGVAYGIYRSGLFGGADMLAIVTFSAIVPILDYEPLVENDGTIASFHPFAPLIVLSNAVVFSVVQVFGNLFRNLAHKGPLFEGLQHESTSKKIFAMIIGHRSGNPKYAFPIEREVKGGREFDFGLKPAETTEYETRKDVWVTTAAPFLLYMTAGLVIMIVFGDILALFFSAIL
ncbi:MAG: hypothetical protein MN733_11315 [Nitrososphaera sp.]|nr:hypothetical protein [Nitrososphaera sp.]